MGHVPFLSAAVAERLLVVALDAATAFAVTAGVRAGPWRVRVPWSDESRRPPVLLSHGFGGVARQMNWLGTALAAALRFFDGTLGRR